MSTGLAAFVGESLPDHVYDARMATGAVYRNPRADVTALVCTAGVCEWTGDPFVVASTWVGREVVRASNHGEHFCPACDQ